MSKKLRLALLICVSLITVFCLTACSADNAYIKQLDNSGVFSNDYSTALPQTKVADLVRTHMESGENKKAIILTFDGARADSLFNIVKAEGGGENYDSTFSGINQLRKTGGLYLTYAGGNKGDKTTMQATSTAPGFATLLTGKWSNEHGVADNGMPLSSTTETYLLEYAKKGKSVSFTARWDDHFTVALAKEKALGLPNYIFNKSNSETETQNYLLAAIDAGQDIIFSIYESPDYNGHETTFSNKNNKYTKSVVDSDRNAYECIKAVENRINTTNEDWLIVMSTDHGGHGKVHGTQQMYDRMIWIACNKQIS